MLRVLNEIIGEGDFAVYDWRGFSFIKWIKFQLINHLKVNISPSLLIIYEMMNLISLEKVNRN